MNFNSLLLMLRSDVETSEVYKAIQNMYDTGKIIREEYIYFKNYTKNTDKMESKNENN